MTINISDNNPRISYSVASGVTQTEFTVPFEFFSDSDVKVYVNDVLKTITTDYTISGGDGSTGTVTVSVTGPATVVLVREIPIERVTDFPTGIDINRAALNTQLDTLTAIAADIQNNASRAVQLADTDEGSLTLPATAGRAGKFLAFDASGDIETVETVGNYRGNWSASIAYYRKDLVKDTTTGNVYICLERHDSSGSLPITTNTDSDKWALVVDVVAVTNAQVAAETAQASAETAKTGAETAQTAAESAQAAAESAQTNAASSATAAATSATEASGYVVDAQAEANTAAASATNAASSATAAADSAASITPADAADYRAKIADRLLSPVGVWDSAAEVALTDGANIAVDMNAGINFGVTLAGNRTLDNPTNAKVGQTGFIKVTQDATGSRTLAYGTDYKFPSGNAPTLTTAANAVDLLFYQVISSSFILLAQVADVK